MGGWRKTSDILPALLRLTNGHTGPQLGKQGLECQLLGYHIRTNPSTQMKQKTSMTFHPGGCLTQWEAPRSGLQDPERGPALVLEVCWDLTRCYCPFLAS